jgi:glycosyltransferase involved in cell wall biosynthesis
MRVSVIVPVYDDAANIAECVRTLVRTLQGVAPDAELIVVDDGSTDDSAAVAARAGARVVRQARNAGAAAARNAGAQAAGGEILVFVDADVVAAPDAVARLVGTLDADPALAAVFGSYDDTPRAPGLVSQYRNLLHHFVHQHGAAEASTFWAGLGAVRRSAFDLVGGFDPRVYGIEDIELGYRLRANGFRIRLDARIQGTHLKRWTLASVLRTDAFMRALPWSRLLVAGRAPLDHLNVTMSQRASVVLVLLAVAAAPLAVLVPGFAIVAAALLVAVVALNRGLLVFFARKRGLAFAVATIPLVLLYYVESGLAYAWARVERSSGRASTEPSPREVP